MYKDIVRKSMVRVRVRKDISVAEVWDVEGGVDGTRLDGEGPGPVDDALASFPQAGPADIFSLL